MVDFHNFLLALAILVSVEATQPVHMRREFSGEATGNDGPDVAEIDGTNPDIRPSKVVIGGDGNVASQQAQKEHKDPESWRMDVEMAIEAPGRSMMLEKFQHFDNYTDLNEDDAMMMEELEKMTIQASLHGKSRRRTRRRWYAPPPTPAPCTPHACIWTGFSGGTCSVTCGGGTKTQSRSKSRTESCGGGCSGGTTQSVACNSANCPIDCIWGSWTDGTCSTTCGGGVMTNTRVKTQPELYGGACDGGPELPNQVCGEDPCPMGCEWGDWKNGTCSKSCDGGTMTNTREKTVQELHGGDCDNKTENPNQPCNTEDCPEIKAAAMHMGDVGFLVHFGLWTILWLNLL